MGLNCVSLRFDVVTFFVSFFFGKALSTHKVEAAGRQNFL